MKYYKALNDRCMILPNRSKRLFFLKDELLTEKELLKYCKRYAWDFNKIVENNFSTVEISKRQIYYFFGCRFA